MKDYSTNDIIKGIGRRNGQVIAHVYESCYTQITGLILTNGGNDHDVKDIFQEAMLLIFQKITGPGLELTCRFSTYMYSVCRFLWLQELEKRAGHPSGSEYIELVTEEKRPDDRKQAAELKLYEKHFRELGRECQQVLNMYFRRASMEEITVAMGYKNVQITRDKKYRCKKSLMNRIYNNPEYKLLQDEIYLAG